MHKLVLLNIFACLRQGQLLEEEALAGVPTLVYANKQDLLNAMSVTQHVSRASFVSRHGPPLP